MLALNFSLSIFLILPLFLPMTRALFIESIFALSLRAIEVLIESLHLLKRISHSLIPT